MEAAPSRLPAGAMMVHHRRRAVVRLFIWRVAGVVAWEIKNRPAGRAVGGQGRQSAIYFDATFPACYKQSIVLSILLPFFQHVKDSSPLAGT